MTERVIHSVLTKAFYAMVIMCLAFAGAAYAKPVDSDITPISVGNDVTSGDTTPPEDEDEEKPIHHTKHAPLRDADDDALQAPPGKPFLLEKGFADVDKRDDFSVAAGDAGHITLHFCGENTFILPDSKDYFGPDKHLPVCEAEVYTKKSCPKSFIPVMKITPYSTSPSILTPIFACIGPIDANDSTYKTGLFNRGSGGYQAYVQTPATSASGGTELVPFVSFSWEVHCYPNKKFVGRSASSSTMFAQENLEKPPIQHCHIPDLRNIDYPVLLWDLGTIKWPGDWQYPDRVQTTTTHRKCPNGYEPYATISAGIPYENHPGGKSSPGSASLMNPSGVCVNSLTDSSDGSAYIINYIARASTMQIEFSATNLEIHDPTVIADFGPIEWKLFCYPPNMSPPSFASNCSLTDGYYKPE